MKKNKERIKKEGMSERKIKDQRLRIKERKIKRKEKKKEIQ